MPHAPAHTALVGLSLALLGCAKPNVEGADDGARDRQLETPSEAPASCPASDVREVRYASTVDGHVPAEIGALRCVADLSALADDIACAVAFNQANWERALSARGLAPVDVPAQEWWALRGYPAMALGAVVEHPEEPGRRGVFVGMDEDDCSGVNVHSPVAPSPRLAEREGGELVLVVAKPVVESRTYARCSCHSGCGTEREPLPLIIDLPKRGKFVGVEELAYPAIAIVSHDVESTTCCCAP